MSSELPAPHPVAEAGITQAGLLSIRANTWFCSGLRTTQWNNIQEANTLLKGTPMCHEDVKTKASAKQAAFHCSPQLSSHAGADLPLRIPNLSLELISSMELHHSRTSFLFKFHFPLCVSACTAHTALSAYLGVGSILSSDVKLPCFTTANRLEKGRVWSLTLHSDWGSVGRLAWK